MYSTLLTIHSITRWLVLAALLLAIFRAWRGWIEKKSFTPADNSIRHWTATIAHIQLLVGITLYFISPLIDYFLHDYSEAVHQRQVRFFGMEHSLMMLTAVVLITIGSAKAKRKSTDAEKFRTMATWYSIALLIILVSVPWPFSPLAARPWLRAF